MYHIPNDKRAKQSAELLSKALLECLENKSFDKISVSDLNSRCYVSRSTFYRLFDNTSDILRYMCDSMFEEVIVLLGKTHFNSPRNMMVALNREVMSRNAIINAIEKSGRTDILYSTHEKYSSHFMNYFNAYSETLSPRELDCINRIMAASLNAYISLWVEKGKHETPEELTDMVMKSFQVIAQIANN